MSGNYHIRRSIDDFPSALDLISETCLFDDEPQCLNPKSLTLNLSRRYYLGLGKREGVRVLCQGPKHSAFPDSQPVV